MIIWQLSQQKHDDININWCTVDVMIWFFSLPSNDAHSLYKIRIYRLIKCWHGMATGWVTTWDVSIDKQSACRRTKQSPSFLSFIRPTAKSNMFLSWREEFWVPVMLCWDLRDFILSLRLFSVWLIICRLLFDRGGAAVGFVAVWVAMASCAAQSRWSYHRFDCCLWKHKHRGVHCV